jgi:hypothetical protein
LPCYGGISSFKNTWFLAIPLLLQKYMVFDHVPLPSKIHVFWPCPPSFKNTWFLAMSLLLQKYMVFDHVSLPSKTNVKHMGL